MICIKAHRTGAGVDRVTHLTGEGTRCGTSFADRAQAGRVLADAVADLIARQPGMDDPVLLALPRGGVPVALEVARRLGAPLDLVMVRKIGVPWQPELAAAAVVDGDAPQLVVNRDIVASVRLSEEDLKRIEAGELAEIERRREVYLQGRPRVPVEGRDAIVIDDGVATGATTRAAIKGVRQRGPRSLTLAVPVAPPEAVDLLAPEVDHLVCLETPANFQAIGLHYTDFRQTSDAEVVAMLREAEALLPHAP